MARFLSRYLGSQPHPLSHLALENCTLSPDTIVDEDAPAYPPGASFEVQELTAEGYAALLRSNGGGCATARSSGR